MQQDRNSLAGRRSECCGLAIGRQCILACPFGIALWWTEDRKFEDQVYGFGVDPL